MTVPEIATDTHVAWLTITDNYDTIDGVAEVPISSVAPGYRFQLVFTSGKRLPGTVVRHTRGSTAVLLDGLEKERTFTTKDGAVVSLKKQGGIQHWAPETAVLRIDGQRNIDKWLSTGPNTNTAAPVNSSDTEKTMDIATERTVSLLGGTPRGKARGRKARKAPKGGKKAAPKTRVAKELNACKCGCGDKVTGNFRQGHDARYYGLLKKVAREIIPFNQLPRLMQTEAENIAGAKRLLKASGH